MTNPSSADAPIPTTTPDPSQQQAPQYQPAAGPGTPAPGVADYPTQAYTPPGTPPGAYPSYQPNPQPAPQYQPAPQPQAPYPQAPQYPQPTPYPQQPYPAAPYQPQPPQYPAYQPYSQPQYQPPQPAAYQLQPQQPPYAPQPQQPQPVAPYPSYAQQTPAPAPQPYAPQYQPQYQPPTPPQQPYIPQYAPPQPVQPVQPVQTPPAQPNIQGAQTGAAPARFEPQLGMQLQIGEMRFGFMPHPILGAEMDEVYVVEGGEALIYQLQDVATGALYALKVMKPSYRGEEIARSVASLLPYASQPGLQLGNRVCLTRATYPALVAALPDLEYAVLMPWLMGRTWAGLLTDRAASETYYAADALRVALRTAQALWELEAHHMAHTDVASGNVMLLSEKGEIALLDVETLFMSSAPAPRFQRLGTPGYQHPRLDAHGQWRPDGDRFAGAVLLAEMLAWWDPTVRALTPDGAETLFSPQELQSLTLPRWQATRDALWSVCPPSLALFDQAWASADLADCPELGAWAMVLLQQSAV